MALPRGAVYAPVVKGEAKQHQAQASPMETQHFVDMTGPSYLYGVGSKRGAEELEEEEEELEVCPPPLLFTSPPYPLVFLLGRRRPFSAVWNHP